MKNFKEFVIEELTHETVNKKYGKYSGKVFLPTKIKYEEGVYLVYSPNNIVEGVSKTYPSKKAVKMVINNLKSKKELIPNSLYDLEARLNNINDSHIEKHLNFCLTQDDFSESLFDLIKNAFLGCGYDLGAKWTANNYGERVEVLQFEPLYANEKTTELGDFFYHITTKQAYSKIKKIGFTPTNKCKVKGFTYTGRCYFFVRDNEDEMINYIKQSLKIENNDDGNLGCVIIKIDRTKISNMRFWGDPNMQDGKAVFTYENVPPTAIESIKEV